MDFFSSPAGLLYIIGEKGYTVLGLMFYLLAVLLTTYVVRKKAWNASILKYKRLLDNLSGDEHPKKHNEVFNSNNELLKSFQNCDLIINPNSLNRKDDMLLLNEVLSIIKEGYADPGFDVNQIIVKVGMSRSVFYKKFQSISSQSANNILKNFRLNKAAELLSSGQCSVSQAAYDCGFSDPAYFSKLFKERFNTPPKSYILQECKYDKQMIHHH